MSSTTSPRLGWVAPPFEGPPTGGTLYNARLSAALCAEGYRVTRVDPDAVATAEAPNLWLVDSLYLARLPALAVAADASTRVILVLHYLPSWLREGRIDAAVLDADELDAVEASDAVLCTSETTRDALVRGSLLPIERSLVVTPGAEGSPAPFRAPQAPGEVPIEAPIEALVVGAVTEGKGLLVLLRELEAAMTARDRLRLGVVGSLEAEPHYAAACRAQAARLPPTASVRFEGALAAEAMPARMARADLLVSASRMESYGMAVAEARALGLPVLALAAGHLPALVHAQTGGQLVADAPALARALLALAGDPAQLAVRANSARTHARPRSWQTAARELIAQLRALTSPTR